MPARKANVTRATLTESFISVMPEQASAFKKMNSKDYSTRLKVVVKR